jgi:hypothetical protein
MVSLQGLGKMQMVNYIQVALAMWLFKVDLEVEVASTSPFFMASSS